MNSIAWTWNPGTWAFNNQTANLSVIAVFEWLMKGVYTAAYSVSFQQLCKTTYREYDMFLPL